MPDPTNAARQQRWRDRQAGRLAPAPQLTCQACGRRHTGARGVLCASCWTSLTPEGRADRVARVTRAQKRKRDDL